LKRCLASPFAGCLQAGHMQPAPTLAASAPVIASSRRRCCGRGNRHRRSSGNMLGSGCDGLGGGYSVALVRQRNFQRRKAPSRFQQMADERLAEVQTRVQPSHLLADRRPGTSTRGAGLLWWNTITGDVGIRLMKARRSPDRRVHPATLRNIRLCRHRSAAIDLGRISTFGYSVQAPGTGPYYWQARSFGTIPASSLAGAVKGEARRRCSHGSWNRHSS
jgi:hypothetical protein